MSNLFNQGMGRTAATTQTQAMGIDLQGSQYGPPIPVVYGQNRVGGNVIWYGDFRSLEHTQKVGKGFGGGTSSSYTYSASYLNGLCEGPIVGIANVWSGNSIVLLSTLAPFSATGTASQAPWSHLTAPGNLSYAYTALFGVENMALGGSPTLPNYNYEVAGLLQFGSGILDANPAAILTDICISTTHGVPFNYLGTLTQYSDYCVANGLFLSPVYDQQSSAVQVLTDLFRNTNTYAWFSEGLLKVAPLGDVAVTGNGVTYTPDVTPLVNLGAGDFIVSGSGSPVTVQRKAPQDALNSVSVQFVDRANSYHNSAVVASIDEDMIANGARMAQTVNINGCVTAPVARFIAQNMVQRAYYVRNTYTFKLSWRYCYLEPADLVTLTDVNTGLNLFPVRILEVAEDAEGLLDITAEEFPEGIGHSAIYNTQPNAGTNIDPLSDPGPVNAPLLFRGPGFLVGGGNPEIWCAVCGSGAEWGGADLYISYDGTTYNYLGSVNAPARYGTLTSDLPQPPPADPDITTVLGVQLYAPAVLLGGTQADADNLSTLCIAGSEVFAYETATLTGTEAYNLTYLRRNVYGTSNPATVGSGEFFARLDDAIFRFPVDPSLIGTTIYLKFLSVNAFGRTPRTLAEETAYTYVVGSSVELPDVPPTPANFTALAVADGVQLSWTNAVPAAVSAVAIYRSANSTGIFDLVGEVGNTTTSWTDHFTNGASWYYYVTARGPLNASGWSANSATVSSTGKVSANDAAPAGTAGSLSIENALCSMPANSDGSLPGWNAGSLTSGGRWYIDTSAPDAGYAQAYAFETPTAAVGTISSTRTWACLPGDVVSITARVKAASGLYSGVLIVFLNSAGADLGNVNAAGSTASWQTYSATGVAPANTTHIELQVYCSAPASGNGLVAIQWIRASINDVRVAGSGAQLGDQRNGWPILYAGAQAVWQNLSITYTAAAGWPATATISVSAAQLLGALQNGATISYNASSASVTGTGGTTVTFQFYYIDPKLAGGSLTLYATSNGNDLRQNLGIVWIGSVSVAFPTSGTGAGSGGGGLCVADDMWLAVNRRAGDASTGDAIECVDLPTGQNKHIRRILGVTRGAEECVRLVTDQGSALVCSISTPFDTPDGRHLLATAMLGEEVLTDHGIERVTEVQHVGARGVSRIHAGGVSYAAGEHPSHRIYSHNTTTSKP